MLLSLLVFLPLVYALIVAALPKESWVRAVSLALSVVHFVVSLTLLSKFDSSTPNLQFVEQYPWITQFGITYFLGLDGISLWLVLLSTFLTPVIIWGSWKGIDKKVRGFH